MLLDKGADVAATNNVRPPGAGARAPGGGAGCACVAACAVWLCRTSGKARPDAASPLAQSGNTALKYALEKGHSEIVKLLQAREGHRG